MDKTSRSVRLRVLCGLAGGAGVLAAHGAALASTALDVSRLSLEELAEVEITSVSKRPTSLATAPSAVFVISADDIRHSGAASLAEALRLAPNLQVQRVDPQTYAVTARGFNSLDTANKLLVLIDGRSVYTPLQSGVLWDAQTMGVSAIERIEVISGPGGSLWGSNAVNGVVNVITRKADRSEGGEGRVVLGSRDRSLELYGSNRLGDNAAFRLGAVLYDRGPFASASGDAAGLSWNGAGVEGRLDWARGRDSVVASAQVYDNRNTGDGRTWGAHALTRWAHAGDDESLLSVQLYVDRARRSAPLVFDGVDTYDLDVRVVSERLGRHRLVAGGGYRLHHDRFENSTNPFVLRPATRWFNLANLYVQDEVALDPRWTVTAGLKVERSSYTGTEYLPNLRLAWRSGERSLLWAAASRAVRIPSRIDRDLFAPGIVEGGPDFRAETLLAYEAGWRGVPAEDLSLSVSVFYNRYGRLRTTELSPAGGLPVTLGNGLEGSTWGVEAWGDYQLSGAWRLSAGLAALSKDFRLVPGHTDRADGASAGDDPDYQAQMRLSGRPVDRLRFGLGLRAVGELQRSDVPAYMEADAQLGWRIAGGVEVGLAGANLLHDRHIENRNAVPPRLIPRSVQVFLHWGQ